MAYAYANLLTAENTGPGVGEVVYLAPVSHFDVDGIKAPAAPFSAPGDEVTIKTDHVFLTGKKFAKVQLAPDTNSLSASSVGDKGFKKLAVEVTCVVPGSYAEVHEAVKNWMNTPLVVLVPDAECASDLYYQLGSKCIGAWIEPTFNTGTTADGRKGYEIKITYSGGYIQNYTGTIETY